MKNDFSFIMSVNVPEVLLIEWYKETYLSKTKHLTALQKLVLATAAIHQLKKGGWQPSQCLIEALTAKTTRLQTYIK